MENDKVVVVSRSGHEMTLQEWQKFYGLPVGSDQIGEYYSIAERIFARDIKDYGKVVVNELLMKVMDRFRKKTGKPANINAFNRNASKQASLTAQGLRTAKYSPHEVFMAVDIDTPGVDELMKADKTLTKEKAWELACKINRDLVKVLEEVGKELGIKIRIGNEDYLEAGQTFIHVDVCPEYYAKGKPFHDRKHPVQWESPIKW